MNLVTFGKIKPKFFIYLSFFTIIVIFKGLIKFFLQNNKDDIIKNPILDMLIESFCFIFFGIPEFIIRKKYSNKNKKYKINNDNKVIELLAYQYKPNNYKHLLILVLLIVLSYIDTIGKRIFDLNYSEYLEFVSIESVGVFFLLYLYFIYKIIKKSVFYKHQYLSLIFLALFGSIKFSIQSFVVRELTFDFPGDLLSLITIFIYPIFLTIFFYTVN